MNQLRNFDAAAAGLVARLPASCKRPFEVLGYVAAPPVWACLLLLCFVLRPSTTTVLMLLFLPLASVSKFLFRRKRPPTIFAGAMRIKSYSFPSSHSYSAALVSSYILAAIWAPVGLLLCVVAVITAISRVYLGAHYPSDVLAGFILGLAVTAVIICLPL